MIYVCRYRKGICLLMQYHMQDDDEEEAVMDELTKLYTNLAVCYLSKEDYRRVCTAYNDAVHDCKQRVYNSVKLNYV